MSAVNRLVIEHRADQRVQVSLRRAGQEHLEAAGEPITFTAPLSDAEREDLRWYLEDYLVAPYAVYEERGHRVQARLPAWGEALFAALFGPGRPGRDAYLKIREGESELALVSRSPAFLGLPWELLRDPDRATPLALDLRALDRTFAVQGAPNPVPPGAVLRVLMVIARPAGLDDVGYQTVARPLIERLAAVRGKVDLDVLRPPTREAFRRALEEAERQGEPYHVVHFDGHGTFGTPSNSHSGQTHFAGGPGACGYLVFEADGGGDDFVTADQFAQMVGRAKVPLVVLNACRSGMLDAEAAIEAAVATRLLESGAASVVAMGYSVYAVAAAEFMAAFYEALFAGKSVAEAVSAGRHQLHQRRDRPSPKGPLPLEDWIVPVHYLRSAIRFPALERLPDKGRPSLDELLGWVEAGTSAEARAVDEAAATLASVGRFVGRDATFYALELALQWQRVVVVHGPAGTGKTELAKAFARWRLDTGGVEGPEYVHLHSFEPGLASFGLDGALTAVGLQLYGSEFLGRTRDADHRRDLILKLMRERALLLLWDNFESAHSLPDPEGATPPLDPAERARVKAFMAAVAQGGRSGVIVTSRTSEDWLGGGHRRIALGGLQPAEAARMAEDVLRPFPRGRLRRSERAFAELLDWLDGHPLSLRLLLPHLEDMSAAALLAALKGEAAAAPPGFVDAGEGRLASLGASLAYSLTHLDPALRPRLPALALFEGVADASLLATLSRIEGVPDRFAGMGATAWSGLLARLAAVGVLTGLGAGTYRLHPAMPAYLVAAWREEAGAAYAAERAAAEDALLQAAADFGRLLYEQVASGEAELAFQRLALHRRTLGRLLGQALKAGRFNEAQALLQPLNTFWNARGLRQEAQGWSDRCIATVEALDGATIDLESEAGQLWLFARGAEAGRAFRAHNLDAAQEICDAIREQLEATSGPSRDRQLATIYHQLGMVAQERSHLNVAQAWYERGLVLKESLRDRPGLAGTYHQLGRVAQLRGDLDAAQAWYKKGLVILEELSEFPRLAVTYHQLGIMAQERGDLDAAQAWYEKSKEILEGLDDQLGLAGSYHQLGSVAQSRGVLHVAQAWYEKSLAIKDKLGDQPGLSRTYHQLGMLAHTRGDLDTAQAWYEKSEKISEALGDRPGLTQTYHQLGMLAQDRGDLDAAQAWYEKSKEILEGLDDQLRLATAYHQLGMVAQLRGDLKGAEVWLRKSHQAREQNL